MDNLESLYLGKNKITQISNLDTISKLKLLSLQSNRIVTIENLDKLVNLEELYISHNGIKVQQSAIIAFKLNHAWLN